ncbi:MAG: ankyrin repeat domain-containing protein [Verrucomicrobia bacterium]|nr:ankyrin repeat domain-containing protein [Verrucomicrobiota bacterium]
MKTILAGILLVTLGLIGESTAAESTKASDYFPQKRQAELAVAAEKGQTSKINTLLQAGADVNARGKDGMTVLLWCYLKQNKKGFACLLEHGANPNAQMENGAAGLTESMALAGRSVMSFTAKDRDTWYLETTLKYGGDPNLLNPVNKMTPIFEVSYSIRPEQLNNLKILIAAGAKLNIRNENGYTPLIFAAMNNRYDMAFALLEAGADPSIKDKHGHTIVYDINRSGPRLDPKYWGYPWFLKVIDVLKAKGLNMEEGKTSK